MSLEFDIDKAILNEREESNSLTGTKQEQEILKIGILNIIKEERRETKKLGNCLISIKICTEYIRSSNLSQDILEEEIIHSSKICRFS